MRKEKINISTERKKEILERHVTDAGKHVYNVTASNITQKDINYMVNVINKRLYNLEKKGLTEESNEYQVIEKYANQGSKFYNVDRTKGTIRVKSSLNQFKGRDKQEFINTLRNIMRAKTSTATGTKQAMKKRYEGFLEAEGLTKKDLPRSKYDDIWRAFNKANKDRKEKYHYSLALSLIEGSEFSGFSGLTKTEMDQALQYMANYERPLEGYQAFLKETGKSN